MKQEKCSVSFFLSMCSSDATYWQYSHCIWLRREDFIPFSSITAELWRLVDMSSEGGGPWIGRHEKKKKKRGQPDAVHRDIFSYGFRSLLQWVIMQCWSVAAAGRPSSHMRGLRHPPPPPPAGTQPSGSPRGRFRLQITNTPLWPSWPRSTNTNKSSGSTRRDKDRFNIRRHGSCFKKKKKKKQPHHLRRVGLLHLGDA